MGMGRLVFGVAGGGLTAALGLLLCVAGVLDGDGVWSAPAGVAFLLGVAGVVVSYLIYRKRAPSVLLLSLGVLALGFLCFSVVVIQFRAADGDFVLAAYLRFLWPPVLTIIAGAVGVLRGFRGRDEAGTRLVKQAKKGT